MIILFIINFYKYKLILFVSLAEYIVHSLISPDIIEY